MVIDLRLKRRMQKRNRIVCPANQPSSTLVFTAVRPTDNLTGISKHDVSMVLQNLAPGPIKEVRFNPLRSIIAVDAMNALTMEELLKVTSIVGISVHPYVSRWSNTTVGVIARVGVDISEDGCSNC